MRVFAAVALVAGLVLSTPSAALACSFDPGFTTAELRLAMAGAPMPDSGRPVATYDVVAVEVHQVVAVMPGIPTVSTRNASYQRIHSWGSFDPDVRPWLRKGRMWPVLSFGSSCGIPRSQGTVGVQVAFVVVDAGTGPMDWLPLEVSEGEPVGPGGLPPDLVDAFTRALGPPVNEAVPTGMAVLPTWLAAARPAAFGISPVLAGGLLWMTLRRRKNKT